MDHMPLESSSPPPLVPRAHLTEYGRKSASLPSLLLDPEAEVTTLPHDEGPLLTAACTCLPVCVGGNWRVSDVPMFPGD